MMPPSSQCPQCTALLPPGATKCAYCGFVTPWGATYAAVTQQASFIQADQAKKARIAKAESTAKTGMILALVGLPICCAPLSIVGGVMGYKGAQMARAEGRPRPVTATISMIVALLCTVSFAAAMVSYQRDQKAKEDRLAAVRERLKGKRDAAALDPKVACDLVEEHLVAHGHGEKQYNLDEVHCDGALKVDDRRASLPDVRFTFNKSNYTTATACLERRSRWYVIKLLDAGSCAELPPPAAFTPPPRQMSDAEMDADEKAARESLEKAGSAQVVSWFTDKLAKVRAHAAGVPGGERTCTKADLARFVTAGERRKVDSVDFDLLDTTGKRGHWGMMTTKDVRAALDDKQGMEQRAKAVDAVRVTSGPLLVVYKADAEKSWPVVTGKATGKDVTYDMGAFEGWLFVYDIESTERKCQTKLVFESSDQMTFRKGRFSSAKESAKDAVEGDFSDNFETAATEAIKRAAPDLRLGLKIIE